MIRIVLKDGPILEVDNISSIYIEEKDMDKVVIVGNVRIIDDAPFFRKFEDDGK